MSSLDLERSEDNSDGTNDERQSDFGSTNSDSQMSRGDRRANKTSRSRYKLTREGMKRFLIDQVAKNGHLQFEYLHEVIYFFSYNVHWREQNSEIFIAVLL